MAYQSDVQKNKQVMLRVDDLMKKKGISVAEFASLMGVLPSYISNWRRRGMPSERWVRAAEVLGVSIDQLTGRTYSDAPEGAMPVVLSGSIPIIGCAKLGDDGYFADVFADPDYSQGTLPIPSRDPMAYAIRCVGNSMVPRIQPGEFVIAEPSIQAQPGDEVVVEDFEGRRMVKKLLYWKEDSLYLISINEDYKPIILDKNQVKSVHPVLAIVPKKLWKPPIS